MFRVEKNGTKLGMCAYTQQKAPKVGPRAAREKVQGVGEQMNSCERKYVDCHTLELLEAKLVMEEEDSVDDLTLMAQQIVVGFQTPRA